MIIFRLNKKSILQPFLIVPLVILLHSIPIFDSVVDSYGVVVFLTNQCLLRDCGYSLSDVRVMFAGG